jgi:flagellar protein FlgJ
MVLTAQAYMPQASQRPKSYYTSSGMLSKQDQQDPKKVGTLFEAMFFQMILKEMRNGELAEPLFNSPAMKMQREMYDDELAMQLAQKGDLGIGKMIEEYIARQSPNEEKTSLGLLKEVRG